MEGEAPTEETVGEIIVMFEEPAGSEGAKRTEGAPEGDEVRRTGEGCRCGRR